MTAVDALGLVLLLGSYSLTQGLVSPGLLIVSPCSQYYLCHNKGPILPPNFGRLVAHLVGAATEKSNISTMPHRRRPVNVEDDEGYVKDLYLRLDKIRIASLRAE